MKQDKCISLNVFIILTLLIIATASFADERDGLRGVIIKPDSAQSGRTSAIPEAKMPPDFPSELRPLVENLHSKSENECMQSIKRLRSMGSRAIPAVPFLIERIGDNRLVYCDINF